MLQLNLILDQDDHAEIPLGSEVSLGRLVDTWCTDFNDGDRPDPDVLASNVQLAALGHKLKSRRNPFADFGVWRKSHDLFYAQLKLEMEARRPDGSYEPKKVNGPTCFDEWEGSWNTFQFAMEAHKAFKRLTGGRYHGKIKALAKRFKKHWWVVALADNKFRREEVMHIYRRKLAKHEAAQRAGDPTTFDPDNAWDEC